jgi:Ca2+-binding EF-hand superfamily protein
LKQNL